MPYLGRRAISAAAPLMADGDGSTDWRWPRAAIPVPAGVFLWSKRRKGDESGG